MLLGAVTLRSPAPPEEVLRRLGRLVRASDDLDTPAGRPLRGRIAGPRFSVRRVMADGKPSFVRARGRVEPRGGGARVVVSFGLAGAGAWVVAAVLAAGGWACGRALVDALRAGAPSGPHLSWILLYPLAVALGVLVFATERARVRRVLGYVTGDLGPSALADDLADARR